MSDQKPKSDNSQGNKEKPSGPKTRGTNTMPKYAHPPVPPPKK